MEQRPDQAFQVEAWRRFAKHFMADDSWVNRIAEFFKEQWKVISEIFEVAKPDVVLLAGGFFGRML